MKKSKRNTEKISPEDEEAIRRVDNVYRETLKKAKQIKKARKKIDIVEGIVIALAFIGLFGLMGLALYIVFLFLPIPRLISVVIYFLVILPIVGYLMILISRYIKSS